MVCSYCNSRVNGTSLPACMQGSLPKVLNATDSLINYFTLALKSLVRHPVPMALNPVLLNSTLAVWVWK